MLIWLCTASSSWYFTVGKRVQDVWFFPNFRLNKHFRVRGAYKLERVRWLNCTNSGKKTSKNQISHINLAHLLLLYYARRTLKNCLQIRKVNTSEFLLSLVEFRFKCEMWCSWQEIISLSEEAKTYLQLQKVKVFFFCQFLKPAPWRK